MEDMRYYEVIPASKSYHGKEPLTYCFSEKLADGQIVSIGLRGTKCLGIVIKNVHKPGFKTVEIEKAFEGIVLTKEQLSLLDWMIGFYPAPVGTIGQLFAPAFLGKIKDIETDATKVTFDKLPKLTQEQSAAYRSIEENYSKGHRTFILQGVTGSGKTRLYLELAKDSLAENKSVIILTPEISLTTPIAEVFKKTFGDKVLVNHSSLTQKQRSELWSSILSGKGPYILIGPRSSLFVPMKNIGLIVVDEFHEPAYKQESQPYYHANRVASVLSRLSSAKLIFGSATPGVVDYYLAEQKNAPVITMKKSAITGKEPAINSMTVNLLDPDERSKYTLISNTLLSKITECLDKDEQAMLFINKRGSARSVSCQDCGHKELCDNCDLPMVYHSDQHLIRCHTCGAKKPTPNRCPECGSMNIFFSSPGTKAIEEQLSKIFPSAKVMRFDKDNKKAERLENRYDEAVNDADIIVGTQIVAKGHDLPRLSLVAVLLADNGLDFPDFSSAERSYQLIKQLTGRVNRGHREGLFILQSFNPTSPLIDSAAKGSWQDFYEEEIKQRKRHGFPPFYSALKVEVSKKSRQAAEESLIGLIKKIESHSDKISILGPSPCFVEKKSSKWYWQLIVKSKDRSVLVDLAKSIPSSFRVDIDPNNFL